MNYHNPQPHGAEGDRVMAEQAKRSTHDVYRVSSEFGYQETPCFCDADRTHPVSDTRLIARIVRKLPLAAQPSPASPDTEGGACRYEGPFCGCHPLPDDLPSPDTEGGGPWLTRP